MKTFKQLNESLNEDHSEQLNEASPTTIEKLDPGIQDTIKKLDKVIIGTIAGKKRIEIFDGIHGIIIVYAEKIGGFRLDAKKMKDIISAGGKHFRWLEGGHSKVGNTLSIGLTHK